MFCVVALIVFSILGIFSASHRALAREAFDCVFRRMTLRPCNTGFQEKIKGKLLAKLLSRSVWLARLANRHYELLAWIFFILMLGSTFFALRGGYNYFFYGSCNGLNQSGFCVLDPTGSNNKVSAVTHGSCGLLPQSEESLSLAGVDLSLFPSRGDGERAEVVFMGCYECQFTRQAYPALKKMADKEGVRMTFLHYPAKEGGDKKPLLSYEACAAQQDLEKYWQLNDALFESPISRLYDTEYLDGLAQEIGFDQDALAACAEAPETETLLSQQLAEMNKTGIYGTPTVFIDGRPFVGPKPYRVYLWEIYKP